MSLCKIILLSLIFIIISLSAHAQLGTFRFFETYYYDSDSIANESTIEVHGVFDKKISSRYVNFHLDEGTIELPINGENLKFNAKQPKGIPEHGSYKPFFINRDLKCLKNGMRYAELSNIKLLDISSDTIDVKCRLRMNKTSRRSTSEIVYLEIPIDRIEGIFIGTGKYERSLFTTLFWGAVIIGIVEHEIIN